MSLFAPPRVKLAWTATALGASWGGYNVYRRANRSAVRPWEQIAAIVNDLGVNGPGAATLETSYNSFIDYEAGWGVTGSEWGDGWDYAVTVVNSVTGAESPKSTVDAQNIVVPDISTWWVTSNVAPWSSFPVSAMTDVTGGDMPAQQQFRVAGRDEAVVRTALELPPRTAKIGWSHFDRVGEYPVRYMRNAAASGRNMALLGPLGDRLIGTVDAPSQVSHDTTGRIMPQATFTETQRYSTPAGWDGVPGANLDGSSSVITAADNAAIKVGAGAFTFFLCYVLTSWVSSRNLLSKWDGGAGHGWNFANTSTTFQLQAGFFGATTNVGFTYTNAAMYDGNPHVLVGAYDGAQTSTLDFDGTNNVATSGAFTVGSTDNTIAVVAGGVNGGATSPAALKPCIAFGFYPRLLAPAERTALARYLLGYPAQHVPPGATLFVDLRDNRCWPGYGAPLDLSSTGDTCSLVGTPTGVGVPWQLSDLERF